MMNSDVKNVNEEETTGKEQVSSRPKRKARSELELLGGSSISASAPKRRPAGPVSSPKVLSRKGETSWALAAPPPDLSSFCWVRFPPLWHFGPQQAAKEWTCSLSTSLSDGEQKPDRGQTNSSS